MQIDGEVVEKTILSSAAQGEVAVAAFALRAEGCEEEPHLLSHGPSPPGAQVYAA